MTSQGESKVEFNLLTLRKQLELQKRRDYTWDEIATGAGLHINTLYGLSSNSSKRVDLKTIEKLVDFFNREGLEIQPGDLFALVQEVNRSQ